ncbi:hypothetical protein Lfu02_03600 [Longispora fulva]|nr:hypothetical protein Lfu02_03600 [Longispora fulva]
MFLQRRSRAADLTAPYTDPAAMATLSAMPTADLVDTFDDPAAATGARGLLAAPGALPATSRDRITCALRACLGPIDPTFYVAWSHLDPTDQALLMARAERTEKGASLPARRIAVMGGGLIGMVRAGAYPEAFAFLNGLNMAEILTTLLSARGAAVERPVGTASGAPARTALADLGAHLTSAVGVNTERLRLAIEAVGFGGGDFGKFVAAQPAVHSAALLDFERNDIKAFLSGSGVADLDAVLGDPKLFVGGQFFWSGELFDAVQAEPAVAALRTTPALRPLSTQLDTLLSVAGDRDRPTSEVQQLATRFVSAVRAAGAPAADRLIALASFVGPDALAATVPEGQRKIFKGRSREFLGGLGLYDMLAGLYLGTGAQPLLTSHLNVFKLHYLAQAEAVVCGFQAGFLANLYRKKARAAGHPEPDPKARIGGLMVAESFRNDSRPFTVRGESVIRGDVCRYGAGLASAFGRITAALDAGWLVHVRVMSGEGGGFPGGEHSLMVIGHQGNTLTASDSDPNGERDAILRTGFTTLYFDPATPRLSTAVNDEEFPVPQSDTRFHRNHHHRYQVLSVAGCV